MLLSAFFSPDGASRQLVIDALNVKFELLLSTPLLMEYEAVLTRSANLERGLATDQEVAEILDALAGIRVPVVFDYN